MNFDWRNWYGWLGCVHLLYGLDYWNTFWIRVIFCKNKNNLLIIIFLFWKERFNIIIVREQWRTLKMFNETNLLKLMNPSSLLWVHTIFRAVWTVSCEMPLFLIDETSAAFGFGGLDKIHFPEKAVGFFGYGWSAAFPVWVFLEMGFFLVRTSAIFITFTLDGEMRFFAGTFEWLVVFHQIFEKFFLFIEFLQIIYCQLIDFSKGKIGDIQLMNSELSL